MGSIVGGFIRVLRPGVTLLLFPIAHRLAERARAVEVAEVDAQDEVVAERLRAARAPALEVAEVLAQVPGRDGKARWLSGSPNLGVRVSTLMMGEIRSRPWFLGASLITRCD